jgi:manganese-dependent inorganic pyrophosphatase
MNNTTLVIGHRNPDMDAIASAVGYAWLLAQQGRDTVAARVGDVNAQTAFALTHFQMEAPLLVSDVRPRVRDVLEAVPALHGNPTLRDASRHYETTQHAVPVADAEGHPRGLVSAESLFGALVGAMLGGQADVLSHALNQSVIDIMEINGLVLQDTDYLTQALQRIRHNKADDFLVVDASGRYLGLCSPAQMLMAAPQKLILVDHNEAGQSVAGIEEAEVMEVLDHHRVDTVKTILPIRFRIEPVGSCSTLVAEQAKAQQITLPRGVAGLLLCGLLSDTLAFQSVTTTPRDRAIALDLARMAGLPEGEAALLSFGQSLLMAGAGMGTRSAIDIINGDLKFYETERGRLALAQVEVTQFEELTARLGELRVALEQFAFEKGLALALLLVTDILRGDSRLVVAGETALITDLPYPPLPDGTLDAKGVVSRKKQLVPTVLAAVKGA